MSRPAVRRANRRRKWLLAQAAKDAALDARLFDRIQRSRLPMTEDEAAAWFHLPGAHDEN